MCDMAFKIEVDVKNADLRYSKTVFLFRTAERYAEALELIKEDTGGETEGICVSFAWSECLGVQISPATYFELERLADIVEEIPPLDEEDP